MCVELAASFSSKGRWRWAFSAECFGGEPEIPVDGIFFLEIRRVGLANFVVFWWRLWDDFGFLYRIRRIGRNSCRGFYQQGWHFASIDRLTWQLASFHFWHNQQILIRQIGSCGSEGEEYHGEIRLVRLWRINGGVGRIEDKACTRYLNHRTGQMLRGQVVMNPDNL